MNRPKRRRWWLASLLGLLMIGEGPTSGQNQPAGIFPTSLNDPRIDGFRRASATWEFRAGPDRTVVNQVCLVPDLPSFLEAVSSWDQGHYFPILIDDVETSFRFIRAFKPARIVRLPKSGQPISTAQIWERAVAAVGASWTTEGNPASYKPAGDVVPKGLGPTPPGVVLSSPDAPMLAGAVALAAGRFQPLLRLDSGKKFGDVITLDEFATLDGALTDKVRGVSSKFEGLGDECDFLTIAGDWPYRYKDEKGEQEAVDDRLGRSTGSHQRWAFAGRLLGDARESVYRAMCSLFLQPESALMFNGYDETANPWSLYSMRVAASRLNQAVKTSQVSGDKQANLEGWHETFDPSNRFGLVLINSHGEPTVFNIRGGPASSADIPRGVPSAVLMIHSFSAADPTDPATVAGRWLANGAFVFLGSMSEPYLDAFRTPRLLSDLIAQHLPLASVVRQTLAETRGKPWRLVYLGDPLYRIQANPGLLTKRLDRWEPTASWPTYSWTPRPSNGTEVDLFLWTLKSSLASLQDGAASPSRVDEVVETLLGINRGRLPVSFRPIYDALITEVLLQAKKRSTLKARIIAIPEAERSPGVRRTLETLLAIDLNLILSKKDASAARTAWRELIKADASREFKGQSTARVGQLADSPTRRRDWAALLQTMLRDREESPEAQAIRDELKRVEEAMKGDR